MSGAFTASRWHVHSSSLPRDEAQVRGLGGAPPKPGFHQEGGATAQSTSLSSTTSGQSSYARASRRSRRPSRPRGTKPRGVPHEVRRPFKLAQIVNQYSCNTEPHELRMMTMMVTVITMIGVDNPNCYLAGGHLIIVHCENIFSCLFFVT